jgi:putative ABC transport system substrate-binding protein
MKKNIFGLALVVVLVAFSVPVEAQQAAKVLRIGFLSNGSPAAISAFNDAFRQKLRELGHAEGKDVTFEYRYAEGKLERLPDLAAELVRLKVDVIVTTGGTPAVLAAKNAASTIPIIFIGTADPVASGLVASFARPGGNITGFTNGGPELGGKRLELLKETVPRVSRVAVLWNTENPSSRNSLKETEAAAKALGVRLQLVGIRSANDLGEAFSKVSKERSGALAVQQDALFTSNRERIVESAAKNRLPTIYSFREFIDVGGLMSYGPSRLDQWLRAAVYVDKILKGAKPADLPVQQPMNFEFIINLKAAKQIGLTIPPNVLVRAQRVIKE